jgi:lipopolysaccharide/colanic/teichoic acid biosynthesis glycosyltransferase
MGKISKRFFDLLISLPAIILLLPVFVVIAIAIKLTSKGPVIFKQERTSRNGTPFIFYKFRSMKFGVEPFDQSPQSPKDPRLTKVGRFLREYSLDELPQLFNILKGNMSIVGPRPLFLWQMEKWNARQRKRLLVKPGLTGLAQISGRGEVSHEEKLELDVKYVETANLSLDLKIILATIAMVFRRKSIYEKRYSQTEYTRGEKSDYTSARLRRPDE